MSKSKGKKKAPDQLGTDADFSRQDKSIISEPDSQGETLKNEAFLDLSEADPVRPDDYKDISGRFWCFVLYPESAPPNWIEILNMSGVAWACSPLHDKDVNPDGTPKKAHYHVIAIWHQKTTYNNVSVLTHNTLQGTYPQKLLTPVGYYRYFTHADNPEKAQYDRREIESGNGFDIADYQKMTKEQILELRMKLSSAIIENGIDNYADACLMGMSMGFDEFDEITSHTLHYSNLCKSVTYRRKENRS